jgi:hypothetical protein
MTSTIVNPSLPQFDGEGKAIRQGRRGSLHGHVCIRVSFARRSAAPEDPTIAFTLSEQSIPESEWATIERAIRAWCANHATDIYDWNVHFEVIGGSCVVGAVPAFDRATAFALNDAVKKAFEAGLLSDEDA